MPHIEEDGREPEEREHRIGCLSIVVVGMALILSFVLVAWTVLATTRQPPPRHYTPAPIRMTPAPDRVFCVDVREGCDPTPEPDEDGDEEIPDQEEDQVAFLGTR